MVLGKATFGNPVDRPLIEALTIALDGVVKEVGNDLQLPVTFVVKEVTNDEGNKENVVVVYLGLEATRSDEE